MSKRNRNGAFRTAARKRAEKLNPHTDRCELRLFNCESIAETWDHIVPSSRGGSNRVENLRRACKACNERKGSRLDSELTVYDFRLGDPRAPRKIARAQR